MHRENTLSKQEKKSVMFVIFIYFFYIDIIYLYTL